MDVLVLMQEPVVFLSELRAQPIGVMRMLDSGQNDEKIVCTHLDDPGYRSYVAIQQLPPHRLTELQRFFQDHKKLEEKEVLVQDLHGPVEAVEAVRHAMELYTETYGKP